MIVEWEVKVYSQMENESAFEIATKHSMSDIDTAMHVADERLSTLNRDWSGMIGTEWHLAELKPLKEMKRKLLSAMKRKIRLMATAFGNETLVKAN